MPILGKIPGLGSLFRRKSKSAVKTNLMVFLRPKIIRTQADLAGYTEEKYSCIGGVSKDNQKATKNMIEGVDVPAIPEESWKKYK